MDNQPPAANPSDRVREPYVTPELRVYGTVSALTESASPSGSKKDGGPNNVKT